MFCVCHLLFTASRLYIYKNAATDHSQRALELVVKLFGFAHSLEHQSGINRVQTDVLIETN
jgi:hypothetical protein